MLALTRYQSALLLRSHRWLPPLLLYAVLLGVGVRAGEPVLDGLGFAAAALLPSAAWLVRVCVTVEPPAARDCVTAAAGGARAHLASVLAALLASLVLGCAAAGAVLLAGDAHATDRATEIPLPQAAGAGLLAVLACALVGTAIGVAANRPLLRSPAWSVPVTALAAVALLAASASPANAAVSSLVAGSRDGSAPWPLWPCAAALLVAAAVVAPVCLAARRRG
ncbi:ABC transporter [Streptomyces sp. MP131-18]|uniref:ABC transporter n=1 Tax=Streptomyces sp. MP131-18 TaxID=1857892 RepID=UPI00097C8FE3|nr:ABC transporter [Streptomyces sp. MP131-18]